MLSYNLTTPPPVAAMFLRAPVRMPSPRQLVEAEAARLIDVLDATEPDPDLEPTMGCVMPGYVDEAEGCGLSLDEDGEPSLGAAEPMGFSSLRRRPAPGLASRALGDQTDWAEGCLAGHGLDDIEDDPADGPEGDDELEQDAGEQGEPDNDAEPTLCGISVDERFCTGPAMACDESEPSLAALGGTAEGCEGSQLVWSGGDRRDREVDTGSRTHNGDGLWREPGAALVETRDSLHRRRDAAARARQGTGRPPELRLISMGGRS